MFCGFSLVWTGKKLGSSLKLCLRMVGTTFSFIILLVGFLVKP